MNAFTYRQFIYLAVSINHGIVSAYLFVWLFTFTACTNSTATSEEEGDALSTPTVPPTRVALDTVRTAPFFYEISAGGKLQPSRKAILAFDKSGTVQEVYVKNGSQIRAGKPIARLSQDNLLLELKQAQIALSEKEVEYQNQLLGFIGIDTTKNLQLTRNLEYSSGLAAARIQVQKAELALQHTILTAPFDGIIASFDLQPGQPVNQGDEVGTLYSIKAFKLTVAILETEIPLLSKKMKAVVAPLALPGTSLEASLLEINPLVEEDGLVKVTFSIAARKGLLPGMRANVRIQIPMDNSLLVPRRAIVRRSNREVVFSYDPEGLAKWHYVVSGLENAEEVQILEGLVDGQPIIVTNNLQLAHDAPVVIDSIP